MELSDIPTYIEGSISDLKLTYSYKKRAALTEFQCVRSV